MDFQKKQMLCGKKLDLEHSNHFPESSATVLLFSVKMYEDSCEITDVDMGPCLHTAGCPARAALQGQYQSRTAIAAGWEGCQEEDRSCIRGGGRER